MPPKQKPEPIETPASTEASQDAPVVTDGVINGEAVASQHGATIETPATPKAFTIDDLKASGGTDWEKRPQRVMARAAHAGEVINGTLALEGQYVMAVGSQVELVDGAKFLAMFAPLYVAPVEGFYIITVTDIAKVPEHLKKDGALDKNAAQAYCIALKADNAKVVIPGCAIGERVR